MLLTALLSIAAPTAAALADDDASPACPPEIAVLAEECSALDAAALAPNLRYETYRLADADSAGGVFDAPPYDRTGVAIFLADDAAPVLTLSGRIGESWFDAPALVDNDEYGQILILRRKYSGTAALVADEIYLFDGSALQPLGPSYDPETDSGIIPELSAQLPDGLAIWKGVVIDYRTLTGRSMLWRPEDANCCPSGGSVEFTLRLSDDRSRFVVQDFRLLPPVMGGCR